MNKRVTPEELTASSKSIQTSALIPDLTAGADEKLLALEKQLDALIKRYEAACSFFNPLWEKDQKLMQRWCENHPNRKPGEFEEWLSHSESRRLLRTAEKTHEHPDDVTRECDPVARAIMATPARTVAGLKVKAKLARFDASHMWNESDRDADWDHLVVRSLVDSVLKFPPDMAHTLQECANGNSGPSREAQRNCR